MVSQSQAGELLTLLERIGAGSGCQVLVTEKVDSTIKQQQQCVTQQEDKVDTDVVANGPCSDNTKLSIEDAELFSLCKEIQDLVDGPSNTLTNKDIDVVSLLSSTSPGKITSNVITNNKTQDTTNTTDPLSEIFNLLDSDSGFGSEADNNNDFSNASTIEDDLLDLFPDLASV